MPSSRRIVRSTQMLDENSTNMFEAIISVEKPSRTTRRSMPRVSPGTSNPANNATTAVTVTACPAKASDTLRAAAIGVSRLAGRYSAVNRPNTPIANENTAIQAAEVGAASPAWPRGVLAKGSLIQLLITFLPRKQSQPRV
ncbi:hypothetical protein G6F59_017701 [Rhizopus arrhizus]|nr:hypothetical protein G6F59_017701 [Rhizopus arrhizus]